MDKANATIALTDASEHRILFSKELVREKDALANALVDLKRIEETSGVLLPTGQAGSKEYGNVPTSKLPESALQHVRKEREVKYHQRSLGYSFANMRQPALKRLKRGDSIQVLDRASLSDHKSGWFRGPYYHLGRCFWGACYVLICANKSLIALWEQTFRP